MILTTLPLKTAVDRFNASAVVTGALQLHAHADPVLMTKKKSTYKNKSNLVGFMTDRKCTKKFEFITSASLRSPSYYQVAHPIDATTQSLEPAQPRCVKNSKKNQPSRERRGVDFWIIIITACAANGKKPQRNTRDDAIKLNRARPAVSREVSAVVDDIVYFFQ